MEKYKRLIQLFMHNSKIEILRNMQYNVDFILYSFISLFYTGIGPVVQLIIFKNTKGYPGWNIESIILFQGMVILIFGINKLIFHRVRSNINYIFKTGSFDQILLKPYPPIAVILSNGFYLESITSIIAGFIIINYSLVKLNINFSIYHILIFLVTIVCGLLLTASINILYATFTLHLINTEKFSEIIDTLLSFKEFPLQIFPRAIQLLITTKFPIAIFAYIPTQVLLDRMDFSLLLAIGFSIIAFIISLRIWNKYMYKYVSLGG